MNAVVKTYDMTEDEYARRKAEYHAMLEEKQKRQREYAKQYKLRRKTDALLSGQVVAGRSR